MDARRKFIVPLEAAWEYPVSKVGGKTRNASRCRREGFRIPDGFCVTTDSYRAFLDANRLGGLIDMEVMRKPFEDMRWEEIWDISLRIRSAFVRAHFPEFLEKAILEELSQWPEDTAFAVRSSSPDEDSKKYSFAGVHESYVNVLGRQEVLEKVKLVWASLWSDRSLLYKKEKSLDALNSSMAVLIQRMEQREVSGLAFTADPASKDKDVIIIEAIRGTLDLLVDNIKTPERLVMNKGSGEVQIHIRPGEESIMEADSIDFLYTRVMELEKAFGELVDIEWTGLGEGFTVLQVRPITGFAEDKNKERQWYLTLTPKKQKLIGLAERVENMLVPQLQRECEEFSNQTPGLLGKSDFLQELNKRGESYDKWTKIYWDEFIPFAHGIRQFGTFYNDLVKPEDAYEFVDLLKTEMLLAKKRNQEMETLASQLQNYPELRNMLKEMLGDQYGGGALLDALEEIINSRREGHQLIASFLTFLQNDMDMAYENTSLERSPEIALGVVINLSEKTKTHAETAGEAARGNELLAEYFERAAGKGVLEEAKNWLRIGRVSWRLRDDDNILLGKLENQLLLFMQRGLEILKIEGRLQSEPEIVKAEAWRKVYHGLSGNERVVFDKANGAELYSRDKGVKPRQLIGQPSSPGVYTGRARVLHSLEDFKAVETGEVLILDAVQPQMTFIVPLAGAIVERRGGMLVHSAIIAREMGIPAVNGVSMATELVRTGDIVTVNGDLGIVVIGKPEFELEIG